MSSGQAERPFWRVQRAARALERLRLLAGDELTDLIARKPRIVRELARAETRLAGWVLPDGPTARAYVCPPRESLLHDTLASWSFASCGMAFASLAHFSRLFGPESY